jgi:hypothetical protein
VVALRIIASRLGVQTLRPRRYDDGPAELERESGPSGLPTATRIDASLKTNTEAGWDRGLRLAGLTVRRAKGGITGMSREHAIDRFIAEHDDREPDERELRGYANEKGFALARQTRRHRDSVELVRKRRASNPSSEPNQPRTAVSPADAPVAGSRRAASGANAWTKDVCITGLVRAYDEAARRKLSLTRPVHGCSPASSPASSRPRRS